ncbi:hypothetical protein [Paenibacillus popilliae]|uniref:Uncharacterized protein n=1 Tax=Paenibacillus popilliae TaxID=78057 RepID=A0ABY3APF5_PAEPP|nr:hypothetical protein [Paenibacillus sp. SDF0028]TQR44485.1 hypothetical protein C7Y44_15300 [Paenibacillus sp. SDF0028]
MAGTFASGREIRKGCVVWFVASEHKAALSMVVWIYTISSDGWEFAQRKETTSNDRENDDVVVACHCFFNAENASKCLSQLINFLW